VRTTVVTGSASGIGRATVDLLTSRGERVIGVDLHDADVVVDLAAPRGRLDMVEAVAELAAGGLDAVVANAGRARREPDDVAVDYFGTVSTLEGLRPLLRASPSPRAVVTASVASLMPTDAELVDLCLAADETAALARAAKLVEACEGDLIYTSSNVALCRWIRRRAVLEAWAGAGIPLNAVAPGVVETPMVADRICTEYQRAELEASVAMPLNGFMSADVPARLLAWLVSEENTHVCGQVVFVDGGADVDLRGDSTW
jgi:NAD(P)-dependent dehydrogenase (short-subunit alcohol dehydrogenase family)